MINVSEFIHMTLTLEPYIFQSIQSIRSWRSKNTIHLVCSEGLPLLFCQPILLKETYIVRLILIIDDIVTEQRECSSCVIHTAFSLLSQSVEWSPSSPSHMLLQALSGKPSAPKSEDIHFKPSSDFSNKQMYVKDVF